MSCPREFVFRSVDGFEMGSWTSDITYLDSSVEVRFGPDRETLSLLLTDSDASITWDDTVLSVDLTAANVAALPLGEGYWETTVITSGGQRIPGPEGTYLNKRGIPTS